MAKVSPYSGTGNTTRGGEFSSKYYSDRARESLDETRALSERIIFSRTEPVERRDGTLLLNGDVWINTADPGVYVYYASGRLFIPQDGANVAANPSSTDGDPALTSVFIDGVTYRITGSESAGFQLADSLDTNVATGTHVRLNEDGSGYVKYENAFVKVDGPRRSIRIVGAQTQTHEFGPADTDNTWQPYPTYFMGGGRYVPAD